MYGPIQAHLRMKKVLFIITPGITGINQRGPGCPRMCGDFFLSIIIAANNKHALLQRYTQDKQSFDSIVYQ